MLSPLPLTLSFGAAVIEKLFGDVPARDAGQIDAQHNPSRNSGWSPR
jgi:hypothetical protein